MRNTLIFSIILLCCIGCHRQPEYRIGVSQCLDDAWRQKMNEEMERELLLHPDMSLYKRIAYGSNELSTCSLSVRTRRRRSNLPSRVRTAQVYLL